MSTGACHCKDTASERHSAQAFPGRRTAAGGTHRVALDHAVLHGLAEVFLRGRCRFSSPASVLGSVLGWPRARAGAPPTRLEVVTEGAGRLLELGRGERQARVLVLTVRCQLVRVRTHLLRRACAGESTGAWSRQTASEQAQALRSVRRAWTGGVEAVRATCLEKAHLLLVVGVRAALEVCAARGPCEGRRARGRQGRRVTSRCAAGLRCPVAEAKSRARLSASFRHQLPRWRRPSSRRPSCARHPTTSAGVKSSEHPTKTPFWRVFTYRSDVVTLSSPGLRVSQQATQLVTIRARRNGPRGFPC